MDEEDVPEEDGMVGLIRPVKDLSIWLEEEQVAGAWRIYW